MKAPNHTRPVSAIPDSWSRRAFLCRVSSLTVAGGAARWLPGAMLAPAWAQETTP